MAMRVHAGKAHTTVPKSSATPARPRTISGASVFKVDFGKRARDAGEAPFSRGQAAPVVTETRERMPMMDFGNIPIHAPMRDKSVDGGETIDNGIVQDKDNDAGAGSGSGSGGPAPPVAKKKAGIQSFTVKWMKGLQAGPKTAQFRIEYSATFLDDATHDPAAAGFAQNAFHKYKVLAGPHKDEADDNSPLHDDHYSRADDPDHPAAGTVFESNDNPGTVKDHLDATDDIDYTFMAEQMIYDTSDGNKVLQKKGPHTGTIKGADPRTYTGIPATL